VAMETFWQFPLSQQIARIVVFVASVVNEEVRHTYLKSSRYLMYFLVVQATMSASHYSFVVALEIMWSSSTDSIEGNDTLRDLISVSFASASARLISDYI
jgi:hypothetical protein